MPFPTHFKTGRRWAVGAILLGWLAAPPVFGQYRNGGGFRAGGGGGPLISTEGGVPVNEDTVRTARETAPHSIDIPKWKNAPGFEQDVFTFARVIFHSPVAGGGRRALGWYIDYPDADLDISFRLRQLTSMKVDPDGRVMKLTNPELTGFPLIWMEHTGGMLLSEDEVRALRRYLAVGGVVLVGDFWGAAEWDNFEAQMKRVLPDQTWADLPMEHPLFHCVFDLKGPMNAYQVPTIHLWNEYYNPADPRSRVSQYRGEGSEDMHVRAWFDRQGRIMILATHNTDISDGWERENKNQDYFHLFSETRAYPLAVNIFFYLMTH